MAPGVTDLLASPRGDVAWIIGGGWESTSSVPNLRTYRVCVLDSGSRLPAMLASGEGIAPSSLALAPSWRYWREEGTARSVPIRH